MDGADSLERAESSLRAEFGLTGKVIAVGIVVRMAGSRVSEASMETLRGYRYMVEGY